QVAAVGAPRDARVPLHLPEFLARLRVPDRYVRGDGGQALAIGAPTRAALNTGPSRHLGFRFLLTRPGFPAADRSVGSAAGQAPAVGAPTHPIHPVLVPTEDQGLLADLGVPEPYRPPGGTSEVSAVRAPGHPPDTTRVSFEQKDFLGPNVPD